MRGLPVVVLGLVFCASCVAGAATSCRVQASFDPALRTLRGVEEISVESQYDTVYFLLLANLDRERNPFLSSRATDERYERGFEPSSTVIEGVDAVEASGTVPLPFRLLAIPPALQTYSLGETVLAVDLPVVQSASLTLRIAFTTDVPRLLTADQGINEGILTWRFGWYPMLLPEQGEWVEKKGVLERRSGEAFPVEFPAYDYRGEIALPLGYVLATGADHVEVQSGSTTSGDAGADGTSYLLWNDAPARSLALTAGLGYERYALDAGQIQIEVLFLEGHEEEARLFATYAKDILSDYESRYGPYPRERLVIVECPNTDGSSMAADGIVWLSTLYFSHRNVTLPGILNRFCEYVLAHEIAHQWWGIGAGSDFNAQNWLSEGLAQYLAVTYFEDRHGAYAPNVFELSHQGILENLVRSQFGFLNMREHEIELPYLATVAQGFDEALIKPLDEVKYENATAVRLYDKGYLVARAIAAAVGRGPFEKGLREAAERYRHEVMDIGQLREVLEEVSQRPLTDLFETWLLTDGWVDYAVSLVSQERVESQYRTLVRVSRAGGSAEQVEVEATLESGKTVRQTWDGASAESQLFFETDERVARATIDPDHLLPDRDRLNNNSPVKFVVTSGTNVFPLDAFVLRPDASSGGATLTYLNRLRLSIGQGFAAADVYRGRGEHLFAEGRLAEGELTGKIGLAFTGYAQPEIGSPGTFWEPAYALTLAAYRVAAEPEPLTYLHVGFAAYPLVASTRTASIAVDYTLAGAGRVAVKAFDEVGVFPHVYLQGTLTAGVGFGRVPSALLFDLEELHSFGWPSPKGWVPAHFPGSQKLFGSLAIELPVSNGDLFNVANLLMVDRAWGRLFVACGMTWSSSQEWQTTSPNVEVGAEAVFNLSAIGGLLPVQAVVGFASPLVGNGTGVVYFRFSL